MSENKPDLKELELANDKALIEFWEACEELHKCERAISLSDQQTALILAKARFHDAEAAMSDARIKYLRAKVSQGNAA